MFRYAKVYFGCIPQKLLDLIDFGQTVLRVELVVFLSLRDVLRKPVGRVCNSVELSSSVRTKSGLHHHLFKFSIGWLKEINFGHVPFIRIFKIVLCYHFLPFKLDFSPLSTNLYWVLDILKVRRSFVHGLVLDRLAASMDILDHCRRCNGGIRVEAR